MKWLLTLLLFLATHTLWAVKGNQQQLAATVKKLDHALITKDSVLLKAVLHPGVSYGHSNGWTETKQEVIDDLFNGRLDYQQIETAAPPQITVSGTTGMVQSVIYVMVVVEGKALTVKLKVLQAWVYERKGWQLLGRQSVKVD